MTTIDTVDQCDNYFKLLAENSIVGIIVLSKDGDIIFANDFFCSLLGYSKHDILSKKISSITHPDDIQHCSEEFVAVFSNRKDGFQLEKRYLAKNGEFIWCEMSISASRTATGDVDLFTGIINDISIRKTIEIKQLKSQQFLSNIFKNSPIPLLIYSKQDQTYLDINDAFTEHIGYTRHDIIGKKTVELSLFESDFESTSILANSKGTGDASGSVVNCKTKFGKIITVLCSVTSVNVPNHECLLYSIVDISERIAIETELKESETNYKKLVDFLPDGIAVHQQGKIIFANDIAVKMLGGSSESDFIGKPVLEIVHPEFKHLVEERIEISIKTQGGTPLIEEVFVSLDGSPIYVEVASLPFKNAGNFATLVVFRDITTRKNTEEELIKAKNKAEESDRLKSAFLANMSHEIRTPMNAIKGFAQLLEDPELTQDKKRQFIKIINQRTDDLLMLINDILDTAKIEAGQMSISETTDNVDFLFQDIYHFFNSQQEFSQKESVEFTFFNDLSNSQTIFTADFFRLRQILINLINNSFKFTNNGHIYFGCRLIENNKILFYVEDTGIGISKEKKDLVFVPFRQLNENQVSGQQGGTGLGLSIVKGLLKLMKGSIWFESNIGKGTTFYFSIPFTQQHSQANAYRKKHIDFFDWKAKTIMLVEDDECNVQLIIEFLAKTNVTIIHARNGLDAIKLFKENLDINLTLMDIQLPDMNGFELVKLFKTMKSNCVVIAQTAYAAEIDKKRALVSGCVDYISKPIDQYQLLQLIQKYFLL